MTDVWELNSPRFTMLTDEEMQSVDGGVPAWLGAAFAAAGKAATAVGAACSLGPVGGAVVIGVAAVALGVGIYVGVTSN